MEIEVKAAPPPLKPGETGMHTNGPTEMWYRIDGGAWLPAYNGGRRERSLFKVKVRIMRLLGQD